MATVTQLPSGAYRARVRITGYPVKSLVCETEKAAERIAHVVEERMRAGSFVSVEQVLQELGANARGDLKTAVKGARTRSGSVATVAEVIAQYRAVQLPNRRNHDLPRLLDAIERQWGDWGVTKITSAHVKDWRDAMLKNGIATKNGGSGQPLSGSTVNKFLAHLSALFKFARQEMGIVVNNPVNKADLAYATAKPTFKRRRLREGEEAAILASCRDERVYERNYGDGSARSMSVKADPRLACAAIVSIETGMRLSEVADQPKSNLFLVAGPGSYLLTKEVTKNGTQRGIPLSPRAVAALREAMATSDAARKALEEQIGKLEGEERARAEKRLSAMQEASGLVFGGYTAHAITTGFRRACDRVGATDIDFHTLRGEAASRLGEHLNAIELARVLGWKLPGQMEKYVRVDPTELSRRLWPSVKAEKRGSRLRVVNS